MTRRKKTGPVIYDLDDFYKKKRKTIKATPLSHDEIKVARKENKEREAKREAEARRERFRAIQRERDDEWKKPIIPKKQKKGAGQAPPAKFAPDPTLELSFGWLDKERMLDMPEVGDGIKVAVYLKGNFVENLYARVSRVNTSGKIIARIAEHQWFPHHHRLLRHSKIVVRQKNILRLLKQPKWIDHIPYE